jgi:hypothetical protein
MLGPQQAHTDQHIDRGHDVTLGEQLSDNTLDPPEHQIVLEVVDRNAHCRLSRMLHDIMVFLRSYCGRHMIHIPTQSIREYQSSSNASFTPNQAYRPLI